MANLITNQGPSPKDLEQNAAIPVQFLPSNMLSWRSPIMARSGLPASYGRKKLEDRWSSKEARQPSR